MASYTDAVEKVLTSDHLLGEIFKFLPINCLLTVERINWKFYGAVSALLNQKKSMDIAELLIQHRIFENPQNGLSPLVKNENPGEISHALHWIANGVPNISAMAFPVEFLVTPSHKPSHFSSSSLPYLVKDALPNPADNLRLLGQFSSLSSLDFNFSSYRHSGEFQISGEIFLNFLAVVSPRLKILRIQDLVMTEEASQSDEAMDAVKKSESAMAVFGQSNEMQEFSIAWHKQMMTSVRFLLLELLAQNLPNPKSLKSLSVATYTLNFPGLPDFLKQCCEIHELNLDFVPYPRNLDVASKYLEAIKSMAGLRSLATSSHFKPMDKQVQYQNIFIWDIMKTLGGQLTSLCLESIFVNARSLQILAYFSGKSLKSLCLHLEQSADENTCNVSLEQFPQLKELVVPFLLDNKTGRRSFSQTKSNSVKHLHVSGESYFCCTEKKQRMPAGFLKSEFPNLEELTLGGGEYEALLDTFADPPESLKVVRIKGLQYFKHFDQVFEGLGENLESLFLWNIHLENNEELATENPISKLCPKLETFGTNVFYQYHQSGKLSQMVKGMVEDVVANCKNLHVLVVPFQVQQMLDLKDLSRDLKILVPSGKDFQIEKHVCHSAC